MSVHNVPPFLALVFCIYVYFPKVKMTLIFSPFEF